MSAIRFGGIASGLDTENIVKELMNAEKMKVDKLYRSKTTKTWTQEAYNTVNKDTANFIVDARKSLGLTSTTSYGTSISKSYESFSWVKSASSSDETVFTAKAQASALSGTHSIEVKQLATGVNKASTVDITARYNTNKGLVSGDVGYMEDITSSSKLSELGVAADGNVVFEDASGDGVTLSYKTTDTMADIVSNINALKDADGNALGIRATFDETSNRLFLSAKGTGSGAKIKITTDDANLFTESAGGAKDSKFATDLTLDTAYEGQNAKISFDGAENIEYSSNQFTINGIEIDLKSLPADTNTEYTIKVDTNVDGIVEKLNEFVESYNNLIDGLNGKLSEKRYKDYQPLSDEEKAAMDEDTIKLWEEKGKSGLLRNDSTIDRMISKVRSGLYEEVEGVSGSFSALYEIGITTGSYQEKGKLKIDETKLREKIMEDPDGVMNLLFKTSSSADDDTKRKETGIINRMFDDMATGMKEIIDKAGAGDNASLYRKVQSSIMIDFVTSGSISMLDKDLLDISKRIDNENRRLSGVEERYWSKFTALEKAMQEMNSQSGWLSQQLGG